MSQISFGKTKNGTQSYICTLVNGNGMRLRFTDYGAALVSLEIPSGGSLLTDVLLGYNEVSGYEEGTCYFGAVIGRNANRIKNARFQID